MATNPYSYGTLGTRWTVGEPTSKSLLDISRVKNDANRWTLEQLITDPDDSATLGFGLSFASSEQRLLQIHNTDVSKYFQIYGGRAGSPTSDHLVFSTGTNGTIMEFDGANHWITFHDTAGVQKMYYRGSGGAALILESGVDLTVGGDLAVDTDTLFVDASADRVGINTSAAAAALHIIGGDGDPSATHSGDAQLILENNGTTFLEIATGATHYAGLTFSDGTASIGAVAYDHGTGLGGGADSLHFQTAGALKAVITSTGNFGINTVSPTSNAAIHAVTTGYSGAASGAIILEDKRADSNPFIMIENDARVYAIQTVGGRSDNFEIYDGTAAAVRLAITSAGFVGLGTASPMSRFVVSDGPNTGLEINPYHGGLRVDLSSYDRTASAYRDLQIASDKLIFLTGSGGSTTERARIDSSGNLLVGTTSTTIGTSSFGTAFLSNQQFAHSRNANGSSAVAQFFGNAGECRIKGDGDLENTNNSYGAISDERLKSDIVDASSQLADIKSVKIRKYTLNENGETHIGVVAQELEAAGMEGLVDTDEDGYKSVKYSVLYVKAVKALQEAITKIETLETKVAALEAA